MIGHTVGAGLRPALTPEENKPSAQVIDTMTAVAGLLHPLFKLLEIRFHPLALATVMESSTRVGTCFSNNPTLG